MDWEESRKEDIEKKENEYYQKCGNTIGMKLMNIRIFFSHWIWFAKILKKIEYLQENEKIKDLLLKVDDENDKTIWTFVFIPLATFNWKSKSVYYLIGKNMIPMKINDSDTDTDLIKSSDWEMFK